MYVVKDGSIVEHSYHGSCYVKVLKTHFKNKATMYVSYDDVPAMMSMGRQNMAKLKEALQEYRIPDPPQHK
jgi:hypothetical protein